METYKVQIKTYVLDEIEINANSKNEAIDLAVKEYENDIFEYSENATYNTEFSIVSGGKDE